MIEEVDVITVDKMLKELFICEKYTETIVENSSKYYSKYKIPKKGKGMREIFHPSPKLKVFQYWIVENILKKCKISKNSAAYSEGCSIKKNAQLHLGKKYILHVDIENYFNTITKESIDYILKLNKENIKVEEKFINLIKKVCFYNGHLVIGSVSAPSISNCFMYELDGEISEFFSKLGIVYTRYADDMIFSSDNYIDKNVIEKIEEIISQKGFKLKNEKTYFRHSGQRQSVTGVNINNGKLSIGVRKKRKIKGMLYKKMQHGVGDSKKILGYLFFLKDIEPEYFNKIIIKYSNYGNIIEKLKEEIKKENKSKEKVTAMIKEWKESRENSKKASL